MGTIHRSFQRDERRGPGPWAAYWPGRRSSPRRMRWNAARRRLPMTETGKQYAFEGSNGKASLLGLFEGRGQLPRSTTSASTRTRDEGCPSAVPGRQHRPPRPSACPGTPPWPCGQPRPPLAKIEPFRAADGLGRSLVFSRSATTSNDRVTSTSPSIRPVAPCGYNYRDLAALGPQWHGVDLWSCTGISAFLRRGDRVRHLLQLRPWHRPGSWHLQLVDLTARAAKRPGSHPGAATAL